jgi:hypothetical protein
VDVRLLGSAHLFVDVTRPPAERCIAVFKDLLSLIQSRLLDIATDPARSGDGIQEVSEFADFVMRKSVEVTSREVRDSRRLDDLPTYLAADVTDHNKVIHGEADELGAAFDAFRQLA